MKIPKSKLPLKLGNLLVYGQYAIGFVFKENSIPTWKHAGMVAYKDLSKYVVDSANNFPEALELLKESVSFMNLVPNRKYGDNYELCSKINKFLKELE